MESAQEFVSTNNFIWLSHHLDDRSRVLPIAQKMEEDGLSITWDGGFADVTVQLSIVFLSASYLEEKYKRAELDAIRISGIPYLVVYLDDIILPQSLAMRIGRSRALFLKNFTDTKELCEKIYEAHEIGTYSPAAVARRNTELFRKHRKKQRIRWAITSLFTVALVLIGILFCYERGYFGKTDESVQMENYSEFLLTDEHVILDTDEFSVYVHGFQYFDSIGIWVLELQIRNDTEDTVTFSTQWETINGLTVKTASKGYNRPDGEYSWAEQVLPHQTCTCRIEYPALLWRAAGVERVVEHSGVLQVSGLDGSVRVAREFVIYPEGKSAAEDFAFADISVEKVVFSDDFLLTAYLSREKYGLDGQTADLFYLHNHSEQMCKTTFYAIGSDSDSDIYSLVVDLKPNEKIIIPAYWADDVGTEANIRVSYKNEHGEEWFFSEKIPIFRNLE